ncbi:unnamed protein product [Callosobruchus maculatus]|uniref:Uncharacterized protein n=1 Tax=Callosobruchus maculatus TaxID=64391 RepID=A0A653CVM8_CALMS|nr:unnamed protein product [Callosobruchus maculatus]
MIKTLVLCFLFAAVARSAPQLEQEDLELELQALRAEIEFIKRTSTVPLRDHSRWLHLEHPSDSSWKDGQEEWKGCFSSTWSTSIFFRLGDCCLYACQRRIRRLDGKLQRQQVLQKPHNFESRQRR